MRSASIARQAYVKRSPDAVSHLRPILLRPLFAADLRADKAHPYSLSEFPAHVADPTLRDLKQRLVAMDLAYRLRVAAHEKLSSEFWTGMNAAFAREQAGDEDAYDRAWLAGNRRRYKAYHARFYREQFAMLAPAARLWMLKGRWKWACWKRGVHHGLGE
jgi:hypothetical protein